MPLALAMVGLTSCQSYRSAPLEEVRHRDHWMDRQISPELIRDFVRRLDGAGDLAVSFNPADGVSIGEAEVIALVFNPDLRLARLQAGVAAATAEHAGRWDDPKLSLDVLRIAESVPQPWLLGSSLALTLPVSGRLKAEQARADAAHHAALAAVTEAESGIQRDLRAAWLDWSADRLRLEETERFITAIESVVDGLVRLTDAGEIPPGEVALFQVEQESRRAEVLRLRGKVRRGEQEIRSLLGVSPAADLDLRPTLVVKAPGTGAGSVLDHNTTLARLRAEHEVAELTLLREVRRQYPDVEFGPAFEREDGQSRIGFIGAIPVPILNSNKGGIAAARAERELARAAVEVGIERLEGRLAAVRAQSEGARGARAALESNVVPLVDRQLADARRLTDLGEGGTLVLLESLARAHQAKLDLIQARHDEAAAASELLHLLEPARLTAIKP